MTAWLVRRFVMSPEDVENQQVRAAYGTLASAVGIGVNLFLALMKFSLGLMTGSLAVTADAANNLSDAFGSTVSLFSVRMAKRPRDKEHPFGHGRMEYIGALGVGALIVVMGLSLLKEGVTSIFHPEPLRLSTLAIVLMGLSVLVKCWLYFFYRKLGRRIGSAPLLAAAKDSLSDVLATSAVMVSMGLQLAFGWIADGVMGVVVALFVLKAGVDVCRDTVGLLLGEKPDLEKATKLKELLMGYGGVLGVHDLVIHDYGPGRAMASAHAEVSAKSDIVAIHEVIDRAEREISEKLNMPICIHMDPIVTDDAMANEVKAKLEVFLQETDSRLSMHDFRMVPGRERINLIFDCVLPGDFKDKDVLARSLAAFAETIDPRYACVIQFDSDYL